MKITNELGLPESIVKAVEAKDEAYSRGRADISVTQLIDPPRKVALEEKHFEDMEEDASDRIWALIGDSVHVILERAEVKAGTQAIVEDRLSIDVLGWVVSGKMDRIGVGEGKKGGVQVDDYKVTTAWSIKGGKPKKEWVEQINIYVQMLREKGHQVDSARVIAILRDWSKLQVLQSSDYPKKQVLPIKIPLWSEQEARAFIEERVRLHQEARKELPLCSDEERWTRPSKYAVLDKSRKRALRVLDTEKEAQDWAKARGHVSDVGKLRPGIRVEHRPGEHVRCQHYCAAAPFCSQWNQVLVEDDDVG